MGSPSLSDRHVLFQNLARFQKSGVPLAAAFAHAQDQCSSAMRPVLAAMQNAIEARHLTVADAFREHYPGADGFLLALIEQGEATGTLEGSFRQLSESAQAALERRRHLMREMAYPAFCLVAFLLLWPVPYWVSSGVDRYLLCAVPPFALIGAAIWGVGALSRRTETDPALARRVDGTLRRLPVIGRVVGALAMARFGRALALLVRSGLSLDRALALAGAAAGSPTIEVRLKMAASDLRSGKPLSELLAPMADVLSPTFLSMLKTGEQTGELDTMLDKAADLYEAEAKTAQDVALRIAGPALNTVMAIAGGAYVIHLWNDYFNMLSSIK